MTTGTRKVDLNCRGGDSWDVQGPFYQDLSFTEWLTHTPPELVMAHLNIDRATFDAIPRDEAIILPE